MTRARTLALSVVWLVALAPCCNRQKETTSGGLAAGEGAAAQNMGQPPPLPGNPHLKAPAESQAAAGNELKISWTDPPTWKKVGVRSAMRKATYQIPEASGDPEPAEMAVFYFGPQEGGGIDANVGRWISQFQGVDPTSVQRSDRSVNGLTQHVVEIQSGAYAPGMGQPGAKNDFGLLGAVIETPSGLYFLKLTGPKRTVAASRAAFFGLLDSMKAISG